MQSSSQCGSYGEDARLNSSELHVRNALNGAVCAQEITQARESVLPIEVADAEEILKERDACGVRMMNFGTLGSVPQMSTTTRARYFLTI